MEVYGTGVKRCSIDSQTLPETFQRRNQFKKCAKMNYRFRGTFIKIVPNLRFSGFRIRAKHALVSGFSFVWDSIEPELAEILTNQILSNPTVLSEVRV
jgi:hypothetical protein